MSDAAGPWTALTRAWQQTVAQAPDAIAIVDASSGRAWSLGQLDADATAWAQTYRPRLTGETVAFAEPNGAGWLAVLLGLARAEAVAVPLDPGDPPLAQREAARAIGATRWWNAGKLEDLAPAARRKRDDACFVKLTSGSTGAPRPLRFRAGELIADGRQVSAAMDIRPDDMNLGLIPWGHSYGLGNLVMPLLLQGTRILTGVAPLPQAIAASVAQWRPTVFPAVPALLRAMAESDISSDQLSSLRTVISAGAPLAPEVARAFHQKFGRKVHNFYGSSETGGITFDASGDSAAAARGQGRPLPGVSLEFGRGGRFVVRSAAVYTLGNRRNGAHRMADIGRVTDQGELVLLGRSGRFIKIAGRRLNLVEVEHALRQIPGVRDVHVAPQADRAEALAAAVATLLKPAELREALRSRLASWKIPKKWIVVPEFPVTPRGKPDLRQVRAWLTAEAPAQTGALGEVALPRNPCS